MGQETRDIRGFDATPPDREVAELASRQWGVVSLPQLRAAGLSDDAVQRRVQAGRFHRLHRGVYAVGHTVPKREGRWLAAVLACGEGAVLSDRSAAAHWGLLQSEATRTDVTTPRRRAGDATIRLTAPDHPRLEVDFCWPTYRLIVETDGWESHGTRAAFEADRGRDAALQGDGWRVVRFTWRTPNAVIQRRLQALLTPAGTHPPHGSPVR